MAESSSSAILQTTLEEYCGELYLFADESAYTLADRARELGELINRVFDDGEQYDQAEVDAIFDPISEFLNERSKEIASLQKNMLECKRILAKEEQKENEEQKVEEEVMVVKDKRGNKFSVLKKNWMKALKKAKGKKKGRKKLSA